MKKELSLLDASMLRIRCKTGDHYYFTSKSRHRNSEDGISKDADQIHMLARRTFLERAIRLKTADIHHMERLLNMVTEAQQEQKLLRKLKRFSDAGLDLCKVIFSDEQNDWIDQPYTPNPYKQNNLKYPTAGGIYTRSKSEAILGSSLERLGIPFRYDDMVTIPHSDQGPQPFRDYYFADIKLPNFSLGITIHEHLGAFQIDNYADNALKRLNDYQYFPIQELPSHPLTHNEITWSFEKDLQDSKQLHNLLYRMVMPDIV